MILVTSMIELSKEALTEDLINGKHNNQLIAVVIVDNKEALDAPLSVVPDTPLMFPTPLDPQNPSACEKS